MQKGRTTITMKPDESGRTRQTVDCYLLRTAPGLGLTPDQHQIRGGWTITHLHTGMALPVWFHQLVEAARFAQLCAAGADWDQNAPEQYGGKEAFVNAVRLMRARVAEYFDGHTYGREPGPCELSMARWYTMTTNRIG